MLSFTIEGDVSKTEYIIVSADQHAIALIPVSIVKIIKREALIAAREYAPANLLEDSRPDAIPVDEPLPEPPVDDSASIPAETGGFSDPKPVDVEADISPSTPAQNWPMTGGPELDTPLPETAFAGNGSSSTSTSDMASPFSEDFGEDGPHESDAEPIGTTEV
jgi:hypothetical protein